MRKNFAARLLEFFDSHLIPRSKYFREHRPELVYTAQKLVTTQPSATDEAMIRSTLRKTEHELIEAVEIRDPVLCVRRILQLCSFNKTMLADEIGCNVAWLNNAAHGIAKPFPDRTAYLRQEAQWIIEDIKELLDD